MIKNNEYAKRLESISRKVEKPRRVKRENNIGFRLGQKEIMPEFMQSNTFIAQLRMWFDEHVGGHAGARRLRDTLPLDTNLLERPDIKTYKGITVTFQDSWMRGSYSQIIRSTSSWRKKRCRYDYCLLNDTDVMVVRVKALFTV